MGISFSEPERLKEIFDGENREEWQKPSHILQTLALKPSDMIADVGAGTGYFSNLFSSQVGSGKVFAIDCEANMVSYMRERFSEPKYANVEVHQSYKDDPCIPSEANIVFLANTYRFITGRVDFLAKAKQQVVKGTRFVIVDFKGSNARVSPQQVIVEVEQAGFRTVDFDDTGCPDHYILTFTN